MATVVPPASLEVAFGVPTAQRRSAVALRLLLALPQLLVVIALSLGQLVIGALGWLGALATGRLPGFARDYATGYVRWSTLVGAYVGLLHGDYPPFSMNATHRHPVRLAFPDGARLSRAAVLFRLVLVLPAALLATLSELGIMVAAFFIWVVVLVAGRMPEPLFGVIAAVLRFRSRTSAYFLLLVTEYPAGLLGDTLDRREGRHAVDTGPGAAPLPLVDDALSPVGTVRHPTTDESGVAGTDAIGSAAPARLRGTDDDQPWSLVLDRPARWLMVGFVALGVGACAIGFAASAAPSGIESNEQALDAVGNAHEALTSEVGSVTHAVAVCAYTHQPLSCTQGADREAAAAFASFGRALTSAQWSGTPATEAAGTLGSATERAQRALGALAGAPDVATYQQLVDAEQLKSALSGFDSAYRALVRSAT
jgi:hypothetical protein